MRLTALCLSAWFTTACSNVPTPRFDEIRYDYVIASPYELTSAHKNIYFDIDAEDLSLPEETLSLATLNLNMVLNKQQAQVVVYIHVANSFLIKRPGGMRKEVVFDEQQRGAFQDVVIQRAHIRTHYNIEVVDGLADTLIDQFSGAGNYPLEALDVFEKKLNRKLLQEAFLEESIVARYEVINTIWNRIKMDYLNNIEVIFAQEKYRLVSELESEPRVELAFERLNENNKKSAAKALQSYNGLIKKYKKKGDEYSKAVTSYLDQGITVSTSIVNHQHQDRYPPDSQ